MKFGHSLRQRSIPAWNAHNIDYDEIKYFIKDRTTPGKGKAISIAGRDDEKHREFETAMFLILLDQHDRIQLFVESKAGEIRRRLDHITRQLRRLPAPNAAARDAPVSMRRLEKYSKFENDTLKAGDEIKSLARFITTQRTAFRKLLKKYKKWTGSADLEIRFRHEVLDSPMSFTKLQLDSMLDDYSDILQEVRGMYETRMQQAKAPESKPSETAKADASPASTLLSATETKSKVELDTAIDTVPFGNSGAMAHYFVHPDYVLELQVLLMRYLECYPSRSRPSTPSFPLSRANSDQSIPLVDHHVLVADDAERLARGESTLTVDEREHLSGQSPQMAKVMIRWNEQEDAMLTYRPISSKVQSVPLKTKNIDGFFDASIPMSPKTDAQMAADSITTLREDILKDRRVQPLYKLASSRVRFVGLGNRPTGALVATMDTKISMEKTSDLDTDGITAVNFPFAVLQIRTEGALGNELLSVLNGSHLVERVRGFSIHYYALWELYKPQRLAPPIWLPVLNQDIRKLPPPAMRSNSSTVASSSGTLTGTQRSSSGAEGTTAVDTAGPSSPSPLSEIPPLRSFRKKRRRQHRHDSVEPQQRYWSEYDHPEDLDDGGEGGYVLYIDPNEKSTLDRLFEKIGRVFSPKSLEEEPLLPDPRTDIETDSDEEATVGLGIASYGTIASTMHRSSRNRGAEPFLPPISVICFVASMAILVVAYLLETTSKHKYVAEVDAGVLFAIGMSLAFAAGGWVPIFRRPDGSVASLAFAIFILTIDVVSCGALLAWILA